MQKTIFKISEMDCPSEEQLIRMKLDGMESIQSLKFDITERILQVIHSNDHEPIFQKLQELKLNTTVVSSVKAEALPDENQQNAQQKILWAVLLINFLFFVIEMTTGLISYSMGLVADSLDMMADSIVYGLALFALGGTVLLKKRIAGLAGILQIILALIANMVSLYLLQKSKSKEAHMQASMIFTSNDIIINAGVILAAILVNWFKSGLPDLVIGAIIFLIVARGAYRIIILSK